MQLRHSLYLSFILVASCAKPTPAIEGVDLQIWKDDKNGCSGKRGLMEPAVKNELSKLKGLSEMDIVDLLGRPDENELFKRNQKFFHYYLTPGPACANAGPSPHKLIIRFNAMGYAQLVSVEADAN
jgi:hypothetical protein